MHSHALLLTLAGLASADMILPRGQQELAAIGAALNRRATTTTTPTGTTTSFQPATTDAHSSECLSAYSSVFADAPAAPFDPISFIGCSGFPSSLTAAYASYHSVANSWYDEHSDAIAEVKTSCLDLLIENVSEVTTSFVCSYTGSDIATEPYAPAPSTTTTTTAAAAVSSASSVTAESSSTATGGPAPTGAAASGGAAPASAGNRETGLAWAAVAVAGMLGAVAML